ncbi:universal stress protein [Scytonema sp. UIC 10036]|uniref:universal stress protein n=1 Tax=Scytonema sp. UIC 10036 TaxID=2304196 RepID=UPI00325B567A
MNIKPLLVRLQNAIGRDDLIEQMVLLSTPKMSVSEEIQASTSINLIVGYNSSPNSHTALDIALLTAHQTRLATKAQVTVQVVYVMEERLMCGGAEVLPTQEALSSRRSEQQVLQHSLTEPPEEELNTGIVTQTRWQDRSTHPQQEEKSVDRFAQAERILRQASCLAAEWKSSFKAHLRFGCVATELKRVVVSESADILFLGCNSIHHPIVQNLGSQFPCSVLGIPSSIQNKYI